MAETLVIWIFIILVQQQGMMGGAGADRPACLEARSHALTELKELGSDIIAMSDCQSLKLEPAKAKDRATK